MHRAARASAGATDAGPLGSRRALVDARLLQMAFDRLRLSLWMTAAVVLVFVGLLSPYFPSDIMWHWLLVLLGVTAARYLMWRFHDRARDRDRSYRGWSWVFLAGAAASGASWAYGAVRMMPGAGSVESSLLTLTLLSVSAVAMATLSAQVAAMLAFLAAAMLPTIVALFATGGDVERTASAVLLAGTVSLMIVGLRSSAATRSVLETELSLSDSIAETSDARERAESASRAKTRFLANMSHELRTPLNAVIGAAQLMRTGEHDAQQRSHLVEAIERSGTNLLGLIENILDLSRIEAGEMTLESQDFHLVECVEAALATAGLSARSKGLRLSCIVDPGLRAWRRGDAARLRQVVLNLLGNAVKFTPRGEVTVRLEPGEGADGVRISVSDTGVGIGEASLAHVFEPFRQADDGSDRRFGGSGLGLAIVRQFVEAMGGKVSVRSTLGEGSCFEVELALGDAHEAVPEPEPLGRTVGYYEPHEASAQALQAVLERIGCEAQRCAEPPELVVCEAPRSPDAQALVAWCERQRAQTGALQRAWVMVSTEAPQTGALLGVLDEWVARGRVIGMTSAESGESGRWGLAHTVIAPITRVALASSLVAQTRSGEPQAGAQERTPAGAGAPGAHVLVVEDDPLNQTIVRRLLQHAGYRVSAASDGRAALQMLRESSFELVLMDWQMPDMDGLQVTRRMRAGEAGEAARRVPIVALTANAFAEDRTACLAAGMNDFLTKPVHASSLVTTIERWLARTHRTPPSDPQPNASTNAPTNARGTTAPVVFDPGVLAMLPMVADGSDPGYAQEVLAAFVDSLPGTVAAIRAALSTGDVHAWHRAFHTLKSSSASVGALALSAFAARVEAQARDGTGPMPDLVALLDAEVARLRSHLERDRSAAIEGAAR